MNKVNSIQIKNINKTLFFNTIFLKDSFDCLGDTVLIQKLKKPEFSVITSALIIKYLSSSFILSF